VIVLFTQIPITDTMMLVLSFSLGFLASAYFSGLGPLLTELFPTRLRGSGQGFGYNFGRGVGALSVMLVGYLSSMMPLGTAICLFAIISYSVMFAAALALPETVGLDLYANDASEVTPTKALSISRLACIFYGGWNNELDRRGELDSRLDKFLISIRARRNDNIGCGNRHLCINSSAWRENKGSSLRERRERGRS